MVASSRYLRAPWPVAAGSFTIAQDATSSVVYGMPKAAAELDAAATILPLTEIAKGLITFVKLPTGKVLDKAV